MSLMENVAVSLLLLQSEHLSNLVIILLIILATNGEIWQQSDLFEYLNDGLVE